MSKEKIKQTQTNCVKRKRVQRVVKNAYVDVYDVTAQPGDNYCEWIKITKQRLKDRDRVLLHIKIQKLQSIVTHELAANGFQPTQFMVKQAIVDNTLAAFSNKVNAWKGINIKRRISPFLRFYDYFCVGKKWWDRSKTNISGDLFWCNIFAFIQKIVRNNYRLLFKIISALIDGTVKYNNTKSQPLISNITLTHSKQIREYLFNINNSLTIKQWVQENNKKKGNANVVREKIRHGLAQIISYSNSQNLPQPQSQSQLQLQLQLHSNNNNNQVTNNLHNMNEIGYAGYHQAATYGVSDIRYTPLQVQIVRPQVIYSTQLFVNNQYIFFQQ